VKFVANSAFEHNWLQFDKHDVVVVAYCFLLPREQSCQTKLAAVVKTSRLFQGRVYHESKTKFVDGTTVNLNIDSVLFRYGKLIT
jgi:hypothetical protein